MSGVSNNHKINGNLILSANATKAGVSTVGSSSINLAKSNHNNNSNINEKTVQQQAAAIVSKLQVPQQQQQQQSSQQQQRRSLLPPASSQSLHHSTQQQSVTTPASTAAATLSANSTSPHPNQLQTVATIHHHHSQQQLQQQQAAQAIANTQSAISSATSGKPQQQQQHSHPTVSQGAGSSHSRRSLYHLQALKSSNNLKAPAHSIPPRYQPPPQPHSVNGGILKNLNSLHAGGGVLGERVSNGKSHSAYFSDTTHLNLKYPPDIPQLSAVYIPDSIKNQGNHTRYRHQQQPQPQQQQIQLQQQRHRSSLLSNGNNLLNSHSQQQQLQHQQQQHQQQAEQQQQQHQQDMLKFVRKTDQDHPSPNASVTSSATGIPTATAGGRLTAEQNRQLQSLINELRSLKEQNQRLLDDNQELRDLCCFLDDDRQKGRKLAREWQRFGRYTASVMRQEVAAYQNKLRQLDDKQQELITDNLELKELCLYLDEERAHVAANALCANCGASTRNTLRDDGDGSSSSTNADETISALRNYERQLPQDMHLRTTLNDQTLQYVRSLERRIQQLEEERLTETTPTANIMTQQQQPQQQPQPADVPPEPLSGRPEAVVRALQVLEVREQLERDRLGNLTGSAIDQMDDGEKALVREMCNVVWRKLEGSPNNGAATALEPL